MSLSSSLRLSRTVDKGSVIRVMMTVTSRLRLTIVCSSLLKKSSLSASCMRWFTFGKGTGRIKDKFRGGYKKLWKC